MNKGVLGFLAVCMLVVIFGCEKKVAPKDVAVESSLDVVTNDITNMTTNASSAMEGEIEMEWVDDDVASTATDVAGSAVQAVNTTATAASDLSAVQSPTAKNIQQALKNAGLYDGNIDGDIGPKTKQAIRSFQEQNGLSADGKVGPKTWSKLSAYFNQ